MSTTADSATTVTVGCKLPSGLILELGNRGDDRYRRVEINGLNSARIVGGHGITEGVDREFMEKWMKKHQWLPAVRKGFVFVEGDAVSAGARAIDQSNKRTGFERLDPEAKGTGVTPDPEHLKQTRAEAPKLIHA